MTIQQLRPKISMVAYSTNEKDWNPDAIYNVFDPDKCFFTINNDNLVEFEEMDENTASYRAVRDSNIAAGRVRRNERRHRI